MERSCAIVALNSNAFYINCNDEIPETADSFEGNAEQKALWILEKYNYNCFADDSGLEIETLNGEPGVYSARYAGENCSYDDNNRKVLNSMKGEENRNAKFITSICLKLDGKTHFFRGEVEGIIKEEYKGTDGFGYDPLFIPTGYDISFAEMTMAQKNTISHRARALEKLLLYLKNIYFNSKATF